MAELPVPAVPGAAVAAADGVEGVADGDAEGVAAEDDTVGGETEGDGAVVCAMADPEIRSANGTAISGRMIYPFHENWSSSL